MSDRSDDVGGIEPESSGAAEAVGGPDDAEDGKGWTWPLVVQSVFAATGLVVLVSLLLLSQTGQGHDLVLRTALDRVRTALAGELTVEGIRAGALWRGATLTGVRLDAADGRPFLEADSIVLRYSLTALVTGRPPLRSTELWGPRVEVSRYSTEQALNVTQLLAGSDPDTAAAEARRLPLGTIAIRGGTLSVLSPAPAGTNVRTVVGPDGERLREVSFRELTVVVDDVVVNPGHETVFQAQVAELSGSVNLGRDPLQLTDVSGAVSLSGRGIVLEDAAFHMPASALTGSLTIGPTEEGGPWIVGTDLTVDGWGDLADLQWLDPRIPQGRYRGRAVITVPRDVEAELQDFEVQLEASTLVASGWARFSDPIRLREMRVTTSPLVVERLEPWLGVEIPLDGWLSGQATFGGSLTDLSATGRMTLVPTGFGADPTIAEFNGIVHRGPNPGASELELRFGPLNYTILQSWWPESPVAGDGEAQLLLNGRAEDGLTFVADLTHGGGEVPSSRVVARGSAFRDDDGAWLVDARGDLAPLSLAALVRDSTVRELGSSLAGPVSARGRLDALTLTAELSSTSGVVEIDADIDATDLASGYALELRAEELVLHELMPSLPAETRWSGSVQLDGSGLALDSIEGRLRVASAPSRIAGGALDTANAALRLSRGVLIADTVVGVLGGVDVRGRGRFGVVAGRWGSAHFEFDGPSIQGLRPFFMNVPDSVVVSDDLGDLEREFLRATGVDPDTLPSSADVRMEGAARGSFSISGELGQFDLGLLLDVDDAAIRANEVETARLVLTATGLPSRDGTWGIGAMAQGIEWEGRLFEQGGFEAHFDAFAGRARGEVVRTADERYRAEGTFDFATETRRVEIEDGSIQIGQEVWDVVRTAGLAWNEDAVSVDSLRVERAGEDPMSLTAHGTLAIGGRSDFEIELDGLHLENLAHLGQVAGIDVGGHVELTADVAGPAEAPRIVADVRIDGPRYGSMELTRVEGSFSYADRSAAFAFQGWDGGRPALDALGEFPVDLSLTTVADRIPEGPLDLRVAADSLDAAIALSYLTTLEQVLGTVSGEVRVRGTPQAPEPEGVIALSDGEWTIDALGVRHTAVDGEIVLNPDRTADVSLASVGMGSSSVRGTVILNPFFDPPLDLVFSFDGFQAVARPDLEGLISGDVQLRGTYRRPVATGSLAVDEATVYVDEFQRAAGVVDLTDPLLFERGLGVDTTALLSQPLVAGLRNPFLDNLRANIDVRVPRNTWLRSNETNVEMAGDLVMAYDRSTADLVLVGELEAVRGSHLVLSRTFDVDGGTVSFIGRPGFDPNLNIQASTRILRLQDDDLEVSAHVGGRLVQPIVTLSTSEVATSESDIISYLVFGQASGELGSSQSGVLGGLRESAFSTAGSGVITFASGALANQFGAAIAQTPFLDYVSVRSATAETTLGRTYIEAGRYLGRKVFAVLVLRVGDNRAESSNGVGGARVQIEPAEDYNIDLFLEDRFLRSGSAGFTLPSLLDDNYVVGFLVFRDWGY